MRVCWISAGVSSFIGGYLAQPIDKWIYIDIKDQHPDSLRFIKDIEKEIGQEIEILKSTEYEDVQAAIEAFGGFKSAYNNFALCTNWLKKRVRKKWEAEHEGTELTYIWGFDASETKRAERTVEANPQAEHEFPLIEKGLTKEEVHGFFNNNFNFSRPKMYELGYPNNNCIGCIKGGMGYWNRIRKDFPDVFEARAKLERKMGYSIPKECFLDELEPTRGNMKTEIFPDCGIMCYFAALEKE